MSSTWLNSVATCGPLGHVQKAPGTVASFLTLPLAFAILQLPMVLQGVLIIALCILGILASEIYFQKTKKEDPKEVVIDEVCGQLITLIALPPQWTFFVAGFFLFRLLDIWKPFPIGYLDRKVPGGLGVMADDIAAGLIASLCLQLVHRNTHWLG